MLDYFFTIPGGVERGSLDDGDLDAISPALAVLHRRTGLTIDPYTDTLLHPDHARIMAEALEGDSHPSAKRFRLVLLRAVAAGSLIRFEGD